MCIRDSPSAFGRDHLLSERWLLGSTSKSADGIWTEIMQVDQHKQKLFINRVMFLHSLAVGRVSVQTTTAVRLTASQWEAEVELACAGGYVMDKMSQARDAENKPVFSESVIKNCWGRFIEGSLVKILAVLIFF